VFRIRAAPDAKQAEISQTAASKLNGAEYPGTQDCGKPIDQNCCKTWNAVCVTAPLGSVGGVVAMLSDNRPVGIEQHYAGGESGQPIEQCSLGHQHRRPCIHQHKGQTLMRIIGIERQIGAARFEDARSPMIISGERSTHTPATVSRPTPRSRR
jgi:hypothetical protein